MTCVQCNAYSIILIIKNTKKVLFRLLSEGVDSNGPTEDDKREGGGAVEAKSSIDSSRRN